jgi:hypothetical protein
MFALLEKTILPIPTEVAPGLKELNWQNFCQTILDELKEERLNKIPVFVQKVSLKKLLRQVMYLLRDYARHDQIIGIQQAFLDYLENILTDNSLLFYQRQLNDKEFLEKIMGLLFPNDNFPLSVDFILKKVMKLTKEFLEAHQTKVELGENFHQEMLDRQQRAQSIINAGLREHGFIP